MTEKRFGVITNWCIYENVNGVEKWLTFDKVVELLNELHNKYIDEYALRETLQLDLQRVEEENKELKEENEQLKDALNQRTDQCDKYYKENEQLKKELIEFKKKEI